MPRVHAQRRSPQALQVVELACAFGEDVHHEVHVVKQHPLRLLVALGLVLTLGSKFNLPLGRLPGDIVYRGRNSVFYFPLATSILISLVLTLVLYLVGRLRG